jgi:hypothetical protein
MPITGTPIYLSTLLLEKNRANGKGPSLLVSDWMEPISEAGFGGLEIWMPHLFFSSRSEWDLIRERGEEFDLATGIVSSVLPVDDSDKSQRLRDAILEACDAFRPQGLKLLPGRGEDVLGFLKAWSRDVPRGMTILLDCREGEAGSEGLEAAREALPGERFQAVLHPFLFSAAEFEQVLGRFGGFIGNLGVQAKKGGQWAGLSEAGDEAAKIIAISRKLGFKGNWSLEFTQGAGQRGEDIDEMFDQAEKDLNFLIEAQARALRGA